MSNGVSASGSPRRRSGLRHRRRELDQLRNLEAESADRRGSVGWEAHRGTFRRLFRCGHFYPSRSGDPCAEGNCDPGIPAPPRAAKLASGHLRCSWCSSRRGIERDGRNPLSKRRPGCPGRSLDHRRRWHWGGHWLAGRRRVPHRLPRSAGRRRYAGPSITSTRVVISSRGTSADQ